MPRVARALVQAHSLHSALNDANERATPSLDAQELRARKSDRLGYKLGWPERQRYLLRLERAFGVRLPGPRAQYREKTCINSSTLAR